MCKSQVFLLQLSSSSFQILSPLFIIAVHVRVGALRLCVLNCAEKELLIVLKKCFFGVVQKYYHPATMHSWIPVQGHF